MRGFAFPALSAWRGRVVAALIVSVLFGGLFRLAGAPGVAVLSMLLSLGLCGLYARTGSLLPGIALVAAASAAGLGAACALPVAGTVMLALGCGARRSGWRCSRARGEREGSRCAAPRREARRCSATRPAKVRGCAPP